ncbi:hypothetical protein [Pleionea sediminis]|uniref:hypothetical protein n=1 Tax=Pleionea sediminis TaxID=2569479 RepID=UPI001184BC4F|nr:hypothetical protein [Pleionea sediminis]
MNKVIHTLITIQTILIIFLTIVVANLDKKITTLSNNTSQLQKVPDTVTQTENNLLKSRFHAAHCDQKNLQPIINQLKKLLAFHQKDSQPTSNSKATDAYHNNSEILQQVEAKINHFISLGSISNEDFFLLSKESSQLPKEERDKLFKKLAKALNKL